VTRFYHTKSFSTAHFACCPSTGKQKFFTHLIGGGSTVDNAKRVREKKKHNNLKKDIRKRKLNKIERITKQKVAFFMKEGVKLQKSNQNLVRLNNHITREGDELRLANNALKSEAQE
jgi:hypothetical protein